MNVTPSPIMFAAMQKMVDMSMGEAPHDLDTSQGALDRRVRRSMMFDLLHQLVGLAMREGVNRAIKDARARLYGPEDMEDRNAAAKAVDHAQANIRVVNDIGSPY